jgi:hypothetical protein
MKLRSGGRSTTAIGAGEAINGSTDNHHGGSQPVINEAVRYIYV